MKTYSVAIRTLGLNREILRHVLESVFRQTLPPTKVVIYIAEGCEAPCFRVGNETYVYCKRGMVRQRALAYEEIDDDNILWLDDDTLLQSDTAERLLEALYQYDLDCIAPDTFSDYKMPVMKKIFATLTSLTMSHHDHRFAFKVRSNGSYCYLHKPRRDVYLSQSASGTCSMWRKEALQSLRLCDEVWLDTLGHAYGDDQLEFYKLYVNGGRLGIYYGLGVTHLDARTSSYSFTKSPERFRKRSMALFLLWHRTIYSIATSRRRKLWSALSFTAKVLLLVPAHMVSAIVYRDLSIPYEQALGIINGIKFTTTDTYKALGKYKL